MSENVHFEIESVASIQSAERLGAIGRTLDRFPELAPTKMGPRDPPRTPVITVEDQLVAWAAKIHPGDYFNQFMARSKPHAYGLAWVTGDIWGYPPLAPHKLEFGVEEGWFDGPERVARLERFAELFSSLAESMDAFWGEAGLTSLRRQRNDFVLGEDFTRRQAGRPLLIRGMVGTGWDLRERALPDVFWLNFFGPSFVERFGRDRFDGLGVRQQPAANGGIVAWSTETPFVYDGSAQRLTDYTWKRPFYEQLGWDSILHEDWNDPGSGVRVPTYHEHRRFTASS